MIWKEICVKINLFLRINCMEAVKQFGTEASFCKLNASSKMRVFKLVIQVFEFIWPALTETLSSSDLEFFAIELDLIRRHSKATNLLLQHKVTRENILLAQDYLFQVKKEGRALYGTNNDLMGGEMKTWLTINSHYILHLKRNIEAFGSIRATWVFPFESELGVLKRWLAVHGNGESEGTAMLLYFWGNAAIQLLSNSIVLPTNPWLFKVGQIIQLKDERYFQLDYVDRPNLMGKQMRKTLKTDLDIIHHYLLPIDGVLSISIAVVNVECLIRFIPQVDGSFRIHNKRYL